VGYDPLVRIASRGDPVKGKTLVYTVGIALLVVVGYDYYKQRAGK